MRPVLRRGRGGRGGPLLPLVNALFSEVNPIPVNAALAAMGFGKGGVRLPLTPMEDCRRAVLLEEMKRLGVLA